MRASGAGTALLCAGVVAAITASGSGGGISEPRTHGRVSVGSTTFCNPLNLAYRFALGHGGSHREAADPTMVVHNGTYWLFASKSGGYWHSTDMNAWEFVAPTGLPIEDYVRPNLGCA